MTKFGFVFLVLLAASAFGSVVVTGAREVTLDHPAVARNQRLTALAGLIVFVLLVAIAATLFNISSLLTAHYMVGFVLLPLVGLKMGSTGYRFLRYYAGSAPFRLAGAPPALLRFLVAPILVVSTVVVFATGIELWLFGLRFGSGWIEAHTVSAVFMVLATGAHVLAHLRRSADIAAAELSALRREAPSSHSLILAGVIAGAVLAFASLLYASPFTANLAGG
jgi:hypothetical protein